MSIKILGSLFLMTTTLTMSANSFAKEDYSYVLELQKEALRNGPVKMTREEYLVRFPNIKLKKDEKYRKLSNDYNTIPKLWVQAVPSAGVHQGILKADSSYKINRHAKPASNAYFRNIKLTEDNYKEYALKMVQRALYEQEKLYKSVFKEYRKTSWCDDVRVSKYCDSTKKILKNLDDFHLFFYDHFAYTTYKTFNNINSAYGAPAGLLPVYTDLGKEKKKELLRFFASIYIPSTLKGISEHGEMRQGSRDFLNIKSVNKMDKRNPLKKIALSTIEYYKNGKFGKRCLNGFSKKMMASYIIAHEIAHLAEFEKILIKFSDPTKYRLNKEIYADFKALSFLKTIFDKKEVERFFEYQKCRRTVLTIKLYQNNVNAGKKEYQNFDELAYASQIRHFYPENILNMSLDEIGNYYSNDFKKAMLWKIIPEDQTNGKKTKYIVP